jgi:hypothetical protein
METHREDKKKKIGPDVDGVPAEQNAEGKRDVPKRIPFS